MHSASSKPWVPTTFMSANGDLRLGVVSLHSDQHAQQVCGSESPRVQGDTLSTISNGSKRMISWLSIIALFGLFTVAFFWRILLSPDVYFPVGGDFIFQDFPRNVFAAHSLQSGEIPLWNPYTMTGQPFAIDPNVGFFYPLKLLLMLVVPGFTYREMELLLILHYLLSGLFTYALGRDLGMTKSGAVTAGLAFMFSGFMIGQMEHPYIVITAMWLPLVFLFLRRAILHGGTTDALLAGIFLAISIFGGHQQFSIMMVMWILLWLAGYWLVVNRSAFWRNVRSMALIFGSAFAASAVQILPAVEIIGQSIRGQVGAAEAAAINLPPIGWITLISPHFFGPTSMEAESVWNGYGNWNEAYGYVGVIALFLAIVGLALRGRNLPVLSRYEAWFLAGTVPLALLLAAGNDTPVYGWAFAAVPIFRFMRVPARYVYWLDTSLPLLAGFGIDFFSARGTARPSWHRAVIGSVALVFAAAVLVRATVPMTPARAGDLSLFLLLIGGLLSALVFHVRLRRSRTLLVALVIALLALDLFAAQSTYNLTMHDPLTTFRLPEGLDRQRVGDLYRIDATVEAQADLEPLVGQIHSIPMLSGLTWNPFDLTSVREYWGEDDRESPTYDFLAVKYLIAPRGAKLSPKWTPQPIADSRLQVFENTQAWPRASMVFQSIVEPDRQKALDLVRNDAFDPRKTVLLESGIPISRPGANGTVRIVTSTNNSLALQADTSQDGYLVLSDAYYPGWRVWVDEREQELLRANYAFRAVWLETGQHTVRFQFDPLSWRIGLVISAVTWCALGLGGAIYAVTRIRRKRLVSHPQNRAVVE